MYKGLSEEEKKLEREKALRVEHGRSVLAPFQHPKTHGIPVVMLHVRGHDHRSLDLFLHFASHAASSLAIPVSGIARLPTQRSLWTVPKGPFVHKKNQENFERKVHKRALKAWDANDAVVERWIRYLQMYPQPGIGVRIVRWHRAPIGIGRKTAAKVSKERMEELHAENVTDAQKVQELARRIVEQEMGKNELEVIAQGAEKEIQKEDKVDTAPENSKPTS